MLAENRVDDLRDDRIVVSDDAGEDRLTGAKMGDEVFAHLLLG